MIRVRVIAVDRYMILEKQSNRISWNVEGKKEGQQMKPGRVNPYSVSQTEVFEARSHEIIFWKDSTLRASIFRNGWALPNKRQITSLGE